MTEINAVIYEGDHPGDIKRRLEDSVADKADPSAAKEVIGNVRDYMKANGFLRENGGSVRFVGSFTVHTGNYKIAICSFPKYLREKPIDNPEAVMKKVRIVIEKTGHLFDYELSDAEFNPYYHNRKGCRVSRYDLAEWLVEDYRQHGIFSVREKRYTKDRRGRIAWNRTILKTIPLIDGDTVAYTSPISRYVSKNENTLLSDIHRCAVKEAIEYLGGEASGIQEPLFKEELLGHLQEYSSAIKSVQRTVFLERDILLLRYLEAWCLYESSYYLKPIGTVSFELVWEDVLRAVFGHKALGGKVGFGAPRYVIGGKTYVLDGDSIPDGMNFWKKENEIRFIVIDGKYYLGKITGEKVKELPGYKDVAKQIDYFETLVRVYGLKRENGRNFFVLPRWGNLVSGVHGDFEELMASISVRYVGYACKPPQMDPLQGIIAALSEPGGNVGRTDGTEEETDRVYIIQVDPDHLYDAFINGVSDTTESAGKLFDYIDKKRRS